MCECEALVACAYASCTYAFARVWGVACKRLGQAQQRAHSTTAGAFRSEQCNINTKLIVTKVTSGVQARMHAASCSRLRKQLLPASTHHNSCSQPAAAVHETILKLREAAHVLSKEGMDGTCALLMPSATAV